ncbi:DUF4336 domain-containing protein [Salinarimonas soli]|uniref:DUF4336 domain-containing protein n=1 Tax=Salinarimonas soli TaxID=1638099 RepID=A0A5B2VAJ9_9HYPH|nr:DUF4336 domain-containing protein [Salinarimonas soli]KAA2235379.1 DUF4336 domain-containing protein [Salinarimonas soli]
MPVPTDVTYPPLDTLKPVAPDVWIVDSGPIRPGRLALPVRMTVIRFPDGSVWLHSPTRWDGKLQQEIAALGPIHFFVAPNVAHWTYLKDWQAQVPGASTFAAPGLRERPQVKASGVRLDHDLGDAAPERWRDVIEQVLVPAAFGFREVAFFHRLSRTLVLTDLVQSLEPDTLPLTTRLFARATGVAAPNAGPPAYLRLALRLGGAPTRAAVERLHALAPERVIFAHGGWFERDGAQALRKALP